jgi:hypothetical protein
MVKLESADWENLQEMATWFPLAQYAVKRIEELEAQLKECEDELRGHLEGEGLILGGSK